MTQSALSIILVIARNEVTKQSHIISMLRLPRSLRSLAMTF